MFVCVCVNAIFLNKQINKSQNQYLFFNYYH